MPKSQFDEFPITNFEDLKERFPLFREYMLNDFSNTYGIGSDVVGSLDFENNLVDPASISGTTSNTFTIDADNTGGDISLVFGTTNNEFLKWDDTNSRFTLSDSLLIDSDLLMDDNDITGIGDLIFTDCSVGTIGGIICANLLDKTAAESISNIYTWTAGEIVLNDAMPIQLGTAGTGALLGGNSQVTTLDLGTYDSDFQITSDNQTMMFVDADADRMGFGTALPNAAWGVSIVVDWDTFPASPRTNAILLNAIASANATRGTCIAANFKVTSVNTESAVNDFFGCIFQTIAEKDIASTINSITGGQFKSLLSSKHADADVATSIAGRFTTTISANTVGTNLNTMYGGLFEFTTGSSPQFISITDSYGLYVTGLDVFFSTVNQTGLWIEAQTRGSATRNGIVLDGDGAGSDIVFGGGQDAKIYYDATNLVMIPDSVGTGYVHISTAQALALVIGKGTAGVDYQLKFVGEDSSGLITWKEDESFFLYDSPIYLADSALIMALITSSHTTATAFDIYNSDAGQGWRIQVPGSASAPRSGFFEIADLTAIGTPTRLAIDLSGRLISHYGRMINITEDTDATTTIAATDHHISVQYTNTGTNTATLPAIAATNHGQIYHIKDADYNASINNITVATTGADTVEEAASGLMTKDGECWSVLANNTIKNWELQ